MIALIAMTEKIWWYVARSSGIVLWVLMALAIVWGLAVSSKLVRRRGLPAWMLDLHKHLGWLTLAFTGAHLFGLWADDYIQFGPKELFVPMAASWQPGAVAWGVAAMYLLLVVQLTSWGMRKLPRKVWHAIHYLSLPMFVTGTVHGILAGTDFGSAAVGWGLIVGCSAVVWFATFRVLAPSRASRSNDRLAAARAARAGAVNPQALTRSRPARAGEAPPAPESVWAPPAPDDLRLGV